MSKLMLHIEAHAAHCRMATYNDNYIYYSQYSSTVYQEKCNMQILHSVSSTAEDLPADDLQQ